MNINISKGQRQFSVQLKPHMSLALVSGYRDIVNTVVNEYRDIVNTLVSRYRDIVNTLVNTL